MSSQREGQSDEFEALYVQSAQAVTSGDGEVSFTVSRPRR